MDMDIDTFVNKKKSQWNNLESSVSTGYWDVGAGENNDFFNDCMHTKYWRVGMASRFCGGVENILPLFKILGHLDKLSICSKGALSINRNFLGHLRLYCKMYLLKPKK